MDTQQVTLEPVPVLQYRRMGNAWVALALAIALHVADEATFGFLSVYNPAVQNIKEVVPWLPLPTFSFGWWLAGLVAGVLLLLALSPLAYRGKGWIRVAGLVLSVLMMLNACVHASVSFYQNHVMPGTYSSPILLLAAIALFVTARAASRRPSRDMEPFLFQSPEEQQ